MIPFQHTLIRKYCIVFGTFFNDIVIWRGDASNEQVQKFKVPIEFAPREKFQGMTSAKPDEKQRAMQLPRMSFEFTGMQFDESRKIERRHLIHAENKQTLRGVPYNFNFQLNIITKNMLDATKIVEQVLFMFQPDYTVDVKLLQGFNHIDRISTDYAGISHQDEYEGEFETMRRTTWTIDFVMHGWLYGPLDSGKRIKKIDIDIHPRIETEGGYTEIVIIPGLTDTGEPTTDINETIPYQDIEFDDDYGIISTTTEHNINQ